MQDTFSASICPFCGVGCGFYINTRDGRIRGMEYMTAHPVNEGALCPKGNAALDLVYHNDRLRFPQQRIEGRFRRVSWDTALDATVSQVARIQAEHGSQALGFLASAKATNEENYLLQKLARMLGTNNIDHCARL